MKPLYIFDLDGTLALIEHRRHLVEGDNKNWRAFFKACVNDAPNWPVIRVMQSLRQSGNECRIWSGRSDEVKSETMEWLLRYKCFDGRTLRWGDPVTMRPTGDHSPDEKLKALWLADMATYDRRRLVGIFEDRDRMVKLWRDNGICCFQVAPGNF